jgi:hypothetical protein
LLVVRRRTQLLVETASLLTERPLERFDVDP